MSEVKAVLLVPAEGDPHGLLKEGPCGARPPKAWRCDERYHRLEADHGRWFSMSESEAHLPALESGGDALVLFWDGKLVPEGMDRAARVYPHARRVAWASARALGQEMERLKYGILVLLDAEGREVSDD